MIPRYLPKFSYSGLTVIMSNRSRFDKPEHRDPVGLLKGNGGYFFDNDCLRPDTNRFCCDIQLIDSFQGLLPDTKCVLLLGQKALVKFTDKDLNLSDFRGSPVKSHGVVCIPSYQPQDACDMKGDYEKKYNTEAEDYEDETKEDYSSSKGKGRTARSNWGWWLQQDCRKAFRIIENNGEIPRAKYNPTYEICPSSEVVIDVLTNTKNCDLYFDLESDIDTMDMRCFGFCFSNKPEVVYVVPCLDIHYKPSYANLHHILRALSIAFRDNQVVAHNGGCFDFLLLAYKYNIAVGRRVYDTMYAQHRIYPEIEKSLGHCISLWTYEQFHKDEGNHTYRTEQQASSLYKYNGKDVHTMLLVKEAQLSHAAKIPGMLDSINQANASIRPFLVMALTGLRYDEDLRASMVSYNDRLMQQYMRCIRIMTGPKVDPLISNQKCCKYFHDLLGYPVVGRTKTGNPSLSADNLLKLRLKHDNPVLDFLLAFRSKQAETSKALKFNPWICPSGLKT